MISRLRLRNIASCGWAIAAVLCFAASALAEEAFYSVPVADLKFTEGELPSANGNSSPGPISIRTLDNLDPYAVLDGEGEAYVHPSTGQKPFGRIPIATEENLVIHVAGPRKVAGTLFWPKGDFSGFVKLPFVLEPKPSDEAKTEFAEAKQSHYQDFLNRGIAGAAWFRHQVRELRLAAGKAGDRPDVEGSDRIRDTALDRTFELFSGGRAISENLQLNRALQGVAKNEEMVPLDSLKGITVAEIDWKPLIKEMKPATDPLAKLVPSDQHLVLFPSFAAFTQVSDRLAQQGSLGLRLAQLKPGESRIEVSVSYPGASEKVVAEKVAAPIEKVVQGIENVLYLSSQSSDDIYTLTIALRPGTDLKAALTIVQDRVALAMPQLPTIVRQQGVTVKKRATGLARYEQQLGLSIDSLSRIVGPQVIGSIALTGSDPFFLSGTDIALVFETTQPDVLKNMLLARLAEATKANPAAKKVEGKIGSLSYSGLRSPDRQISSYVAALAGAVIVTNSPYQLERFAGVAAKTTPAIASLDEFTFFRNRYPSGDKQESALVFLSDATIRRWCGPRWRIAASRETRDAAVLAELQAANMDKLVKKHVTAIPLETDLPFATVGKLTLSADGVQSSELGSLDFMTPIAELKFDKVTKAEADAYTRWRDGYQQNWRWAFDPIALRLDVSDNRLATDLTVMPLIVGSEYRDIIAISRGVAIAPDAGDRHDSIVQLILAINPQSEMFRNGGGMLSQMAPGARLDPLSWLGESVSIYVDDDPVLEELVGKQRDEYQRNALRSPVALWVEVSNGLKLAAFLGGVRAFIEQTAPGMTSWESLEYREQPYVRISPTARATPRGKDGKPIAAQLFYVASGKSLLLTLNEDVLKRALDRQVALEAATNDTPDTKTDKKETADKAPVKKETDKEASEKATARELQPWLGKSFALQVDYRLLARLTNIFREPYAQWMQIQSWNNLPILNEWHRLYPDQDPLAVHERIWHERLVCPGGGKYVWNKAWQTMESSVYGHPGEPKTGPAAPPELLNFRFANFGLTFEDDGLRARLTLDRETPAGKTEPAKP